MNISTNRLQLVKAANSQSNLCNTPRQARERAGLSVEQVARDARICPRYLRQIETQGGASFVLASRLSRICNAPITTFLFQVEGGAERRTRNTRRGRNPRRAASRSEVQA